MRIAYLAYSPMPSRKASAVHIMKMCQAFGDLGHQVCLFNPRFEQGVSRQQLCNFYGVRDVFRLQRLPRPRNRVKGLLRYSWSYRWLVRRWNPDLIYIRDHGAKVYVHCDFHAPKIVESHQLTLVRPYLRALERDPWLRRLVVISESLRRDMETSCPALGDRLVVHHDGADMVTCTTDEPLVSELGLRPGMLNVAYIGNLYPGKGMEILMHLLPLASFCHFHVIGGLEDDIQTWKERCAGTENITFHGFMNPARVEQVRGAFDAFVAPFQEKVMVGPESEISRWMSPLKIFEYMAAGKPIVASSLPVIGEILVDGETALLRSPDDLQGWREALWSLHTNPALGQRLAAAARQELAQNYTWAVRASRILSDLP